MGWASLTLVHQGFWRPVFAVRMGRSHRLSSDKAAKVPHHAHHVPVIIIADRIPGEANTVGRRQGGKDAEGRVDDSPTCAW